MTETRIPGRDGSTTIVTDSYAPFGIVQTGPPIPVEDPSRWQSRKLTEAEVRKRFLWTAEQLDSALAHCGFPKPAERQKLARFSWNVTRVREFRLNHVDAWAERIRGLGL